MSQIGKERQLDEDQPQLDLVGEPAPADEPALGAGQDRAALAPRSSDASGSPARDADAEREQSMLPERRERPPLESAFVRAIATAGVVGIGVALGAILVSQNVAGWIVGLAVALLSVTLSAILWSSRRL